MFSQKELNEWEDLRNGSTLIFDSFLKVILLRKLAYLNRFYFKIFLRIPGSD